MLNIEVIKFEAQDVITASGVVEQKPVVKPADPKPVVCTCGNAGINAKEHQWCEATEHTGTKCEHANHSN